MKKIKMPDTFVIIFFVVIFVSLLTYIVPVGKFEMQEVTYITNTGAEKTRSVPVPGSFSYELDDQGNELKKGIKIFEPGGEVGVTNYVFEGLASGDKWGTAVGIVAFLLVVGGAFGIILKTGAVESGIYSMISKSKGSELVLIPVIFILFSLGGAVFGMGEEAIPFAMLIIPIVIDMGYDSVTGILITYISTQIGFATSWMNPFSVAVAQGVSGIPVLSGAGFRIFMWIFFTAFGVIYTIFYARRVKRNPESSIAYKTDAYFRDNFKLPEIATQFVIMGLIAGIIGVVFKLNNMSVNDIATSFRKGAEDMVGAALVIGMAKGIVLILGGTSADSPTILNTILNYVASALSNMSAAFCAWVMYIFQSVFNFFVVSGSGQAALTMPIMAPLSDLVGVTRQVAVLAFQLGDGFTNMIVPTSGILMAVLGIAKIEWGVWAKYQIKFQLILFALGSCFVFFAVFTNFS